MEGILVTLSLRFSVFTRFTAKVIHIRRLLYQVKAVAMETSHPYTGSNFVIFAPYSLTFLISLGEMSLNFATLY